MPDSRNRNTVNGAGIMAHAPAMDANGLMNPFAWVPKFASKVAAYTVKAQESGTFFNNAGATTAVTFTLPAFSDGPWQFWFYAAADFAITIAAALQTP